jgi:hypothetical protein
MEEETDFGSYLVTVGERDIDLLLMEEFHVSEAFVAWFCNCLGIHGAAFNGAWHSISNVDGETDLLLRVRVEGQRIGVLIENKIAAPEQANQDERYHLRGARHQQDGKFDRYVTCICAPEIYLNNLAARSAYQHRISYEAISDWFGRLEGPRSVWRHRVIREAIAQSRRGYTMIVNPINSEFHLAYWEYLTKWHPLILMRRPAPKGSKSNWIIMKGADFPSGVQIHHKIDQCVVELGFNNHTRSELMAAKEDWPSDITVRQKGNVATLSINVPNIEMAKGVSAQIEPLEKVFEAVYRLLPHARLLVLPHISLPSHGDAKIT